MQREKEHSIIRDKNVQSIENVELVHSGEDYFIRLLNIISNAKSEIHLQTYIFENDCTGTKIATHRMTTITPQTDFSHFMWHSLKISLGLSKK
ncbi:MAG: hypothetical protein EPN85_14310 [Bacteroidetes bacterium]|nr:MAG: hypothetical protein EPN85_14310 [Bacteroidota bacterium]